MNATGGTMLLIALALLAAGLLLLLGGRGVRRRLGLGEGRTVALDDVRLSSRRPGLVGRPDRLIREGNMVIPEEWKSSRSIWPNHRAQMGVYFVLIEDQLGVRPPHGFIVCGDGTRHKIDNTAELRAWVLAVADRIRETRRETGTPLDVNPTPGQCRACGVREHCGQARA